MNADVDEVFPQGTQMDADKFVLQQVRKRYNYELPIIGFTAFPELQRVYGASQTSKDVRLINICLL